MNNPVNPTLRNVSLVGPYSSGKTTLLESLLWVSGSISRKGSVKEGNTVSDSSPEAKGRSMSVEVSLAGIDYQNLHVNFLDCPGSIEFAQETYSALVGAGTAIIVCEADVSRVLTLAPLFKFLDDWEIPHLVFINKMDRAKQSFAEVLQALKSVSSRPLIPQQYPIYQGEELKGYIDLITEQAYHYHAGDADDPVPFPPELAAAEQQTRQEMLEALADFDDHLLEELMEEINPPQAEIEQDFKQELGADLIVPVIIGVADQDFGVRPLLEILAKEAPAPSETADRRGLKTDGTGPVIVQILKTYFTTQGGRLSLARIWQGTLQESDSLNGHRLGGIYHLFGAQQTAIHTATVGDIVGLARLEEVSTGQTLSTGPVDPLPFVDPLPPLYALAIAPENRKDEVKLSTALGKLAAEDPSLTWEQNSETQEVILWGQGEIHLQVALERLQRQYKLPMTSHQPHIPYKETIRQSASKIHGRYKHQTGGHGAFGDVYLDIKPLERGAGFAFAETIVGGVVPKQYIPGVEAGVREYLAKGLLGYPVVDLAVTLTDGSYHNVDSSEQAFKQAARLAMTEGIAKCQPVLLEPILAVTVNTPSEFTAKVLQLVSGDRGQILGYEARSDWNGWDQVTAYLPQAEMHNFIIELRSLTLGVGTFTWQYDHLQEVPEKLTQQVLNQSVA